MNERSGPHSFTKEGGDLSKSKSNAESYTPSRGSQRGDYHQYQKRRSRADSNSLTLSADLLKNKQQKFYKSKYAPKTGSVAERLT